MRQFPPIPSPVRQPGPLGARAREWLQDESLADKGQVANYLHVLQRSNQLRPYRLNDISQMAQDAVAANDKELFLAVLQMARLAFLVEF